MTAEGGISPAGRAQLDLLASEPFARLWDRVHSLIERRGLELGDATIGLTAATDAERHAIAGLLGRPRSGGAVLRVRLADLDAILRAGPLQSGLAGVLALLGRPIRDRMGEAGALRRAIDETLAHARASRAASEPWFATWLEGLIADGSIRKVVSSGHPEHVAMACTVLELVPVEAMALPVLAARVTGTTKGLGPGTLSTLILRGLALRAGVPKPTRAAERRALWETFGVVADDLSSDVLVLNLLAIGSTHLDEWLRGAAADGIPLRLTLHQLVRYHLEVKPSHVWICENPAVIRGASERFGTKCAPIVCSEGQPSTAFDVLLDALARHGCEFSYHGDFDWAGLRIAATIRARHGTAMWRMGAADYRSAIAALDIAELTELAGDEVASPWDPDLTRAMADASCAVFEESVLETLLDDLPAERSPRPSGRARASVRELTDLARCAHRLHLDHHGDPERRIRASASLELLWHEAALDEETVLDSRHASRVDTDAPIDVRRRQTLELMHAGTPWIAEALLDIGDLTGRVPLLAKIDQESSLGTFAYVPAVVRRTTADDGSGAVVRHAIALCGFAELLEHVQGWKPSTGRVIGADGDERTLDLEAFRPRYREIRRRARRVLVDVERTRPALKSECRMCGWQAHCRAQLVAADDVTLLLGVGEVERARLSAVGVMSRKALATAAAEQLEAAGVGKRRAHSLIRAARVHVTAVPEVLRTWRRPTVDVEIAYDIEDDVFEPYAYLHGLLHRFPNATRFGSPEFTARDYGELDRVCARLPETERDVWSRFLERVARIDGKRSSCVYVYGSHERTTLRRLASKYGGAEIIEPFIARFVDVHEIVRNTVVLPTESLSLKDVARWIGFRWRDSNPGGAESLAWWAEYARAPAAGEASRDRVLAYNEDDLRATMAVVDWLEQISLGR